MSFEETINSFLDKSQILKDEPMKLHTSFKIGGPADYFITINSIDELNKIIKACNDFDKKYFIIGNGTNLLVTDKGIRGVVIKLKLDDIKIDLQNDFGILEVGAGVPIIKVSNIALENGLQGLEFASGIPGTMGGAIRMNAGADGGEIKDLVVSTKYLDIDGTVKELSNEEQNFSYRDSIFSTKPYIVLSTVLKLSKGDKTEIKQKMEDNNKSRFEKQPIEFANAGSTFKRKEGVITAKLIDEAGLKGYSIGDAEVSNKHAGFLINKGNATFKDMYSLINKVKETIYEKYNIKIELEILILGEM